MKKWVAIALFLVLVAVSFIFDVNSRTQLIISILSILIIEIIGIKFFKPKLNPFVHIISIQVGLICWILLPIEFKVEKLIGILLIGFGLIWLTLSKSKTPLVFLLLIQIIGVTVDGYLLVSDIVRVSGFVFSLCYSIQSIFIMAYTTIGLDLAFRVSAIYWLVRGIQSLEFNKKSLVS